MEERRTFQPSKSLTGRKNILVMVVDDIPMMRVMLVKFVRNLGTKLLGSRQVSIDIDVVEASNGQVALELLQERTVDLIFLDLMMPIMDGMTFLSLTKEDPRSREIPVIACSALAERSTIDQAMELGACAYITKPFTLRAIETTFLTALDVLNVPVSC